MSLSNNACPICYSTETIIFLVELEDSHKVLKCPNCSIEYIYPLPDNIELQNYYFKYYLTRTEQSDSNFLIDLHEPIFNYLLSQKDDNQSLSFFDYGYGAGHFLKLVASHGYRAFGYDVSEQNSSQLKKYCQENNLSICQIDIYSSISTNVLNNVGISFITLFQVIEHSNDPFALLTNLSKFQKANDFIYLECPNNDGLYLRLKDLLNRILNRNKFWRSLKYPEHLFGFNKRSMIKLLSRVGYEPVEIGDYYYSDGVHQVESISWWPPFYENKNIFSLSGITGSAIQMTDYFCSKLFGRGAGLYVLAKKNK